MSTQNQDPCERTESLEVDGRRIWVQMKRKGPSIFRYFLEDKEDEGKPERTPFATVDNPDDLDQFTFVARCGSRVTELHEDKGDHLSVICWALQIPRPPDDPSDIATFTSGRVKK